MYRGLKIVSSLAFAVLRASKLVKVGSTPQCRLQKPQLISCLEKVHIFFTLALEGRIFAAPLSPEQMHGDVLDIGTGIGSWALRFAEDNPGSEVIGTDLSMIQPDTYPPNCFFVREDVEDSWVL